MKIISTTLSKVYKINNLWVDNTGLNYLSKIKWKKIVINEAYILNLDFKKLDQLWIQRA